MGTCCWCVGGVGSSYTLTAAAGRAASKSGVGVVPGKCSGASVTGGIAGGAALTRGEGCCALAIVSLLPITNKTISHAGNCFRIQFRLCWRLQHLSRTIRRRWSESYWWEGQFWDRGCTCPGGQLKGQGSAPASVAGLSRSVAGPRTWPASSRRETSPCARRCSTYPRSLCWLGSRAAHPGLPARGG